MKLDHLFSPITIKSMTIRNRAVMPAMGTGYANMDNTVSERLLQYLVRRARGGTGLIVTEVCAVVPRGKGFPNELGAWSDDFIPGLKRLTDAIHKEGACIALQLHHAGRETFAASAGGTPEAPSAIPSVILNQPCEEMSPDRIREVIDGFGKAAGRAKKAGFDAVEIHGAHGYLLTQFLSPFSNHRNDAYGGSDENRSRFVLEVVEAVRKEVGPDYPVIIRLSADELVKGGYNLEFMKKLAPRLVAAGVDMINASVGVYSTPGNLSIASLDTDPAFNLFRARALKEVVGVPVIGVGRINDPRVADQAIASGDADLIAFGRQHLTDPDFMNKAKEGRFDDIRWCVACNQGCIERLSFEMKSATCSFNPSCGQEFREGNSARVAAGKKLWVIGSGPAGLSAALAASDRGFAVEVLEKEDCVGGQIRSACRPPHKQGFMDWVDWAVRELIKRDVPIRCSHEVTADSLRNMKPDAVILASGAYPVAAPISGIDGSHVCDARDVLMGKVEPASPAVILGAGYVGMETADFLVEKGIDVAVLEMQQFPPVGKHTAHGYWLHKRLKQAGARLMFSAKVSGIQGDRVLYSQGDEDKSQAAAMVITAMGAKPDIALEETLKELGIDYRIVGDAIKPRRILEAIHEGHRAGSEIA